MILLRAIYHVFMPLKLRDSVVIISRQSDTPTMDISMISKELETRNVKVMVLTKYLGKELKGLAGYSLHMLRQMYHIATSKVVLLDGYCILMCVLPKKDGQSVIQMWHSLGAIKKFGYQSIGKPWGTDEGTARIMRLHRNYDYILAPSEATAKLYAKGFGTDIEKIRLLGLPRIDHLKQESDKTGDIMADYLVLANKVNVLYVPTFRKGAEVDYEALARAMDLEKYNLIVKKHMLDDVGRSEAKETGVIVDTKYSSMDWMKVCDKVITDYSAIAFEAAILEKELYWYVYDEEQYIENTGLNMKFAEEPIGKYVYKDAESLCAGLDGEYDMGSVRAFRDKYITVDTESCTERLADFVEELLSDEEDRYEN